MLKPWDVISIYLKKDLSLIGSEILVEISEKKVLPKLNIILLIHVSEMRTSTCLTQLTDLNEIRALFENFIVMEFVKMNAYKGKYAELYFWRTHSGEEVDRV